MAGARHDFAGGHGYCYYEDEDMTMMTAAGPLPGTILLLTTVISSRRT